MSTNPIPDGLESNDAKEDNVWRKRQKEFPTQIMPLSLPQLLQTFIINGWITWESRTMRFMTR